MSGFNRGVTGHRPIVAKVSREILPFATKSSDRIYPAKSTFSILSLNLGIARTWLP
jgi:hypothetical protein